MALVKIKWGRRGVHHYIVSSSSSWSSLPPLRLFAVSFIYLLHFPALVLFLFCFCASSHSSHSYCYSKSYFINPSIHPSIRRIHPSIHPSHPSVYGMHPTIHPIHIVLYLYHYQYHRKQFILYRSIHTLHRRDYLCMFSHVLPCSPVQLILHTTTTFHYNYNYLLAASATSPPGTFSIGGG